MRYVARNTSGLPELVCLRRLSSKMPVITTKATLALAKRGLSLLEAKHAIETMLDNERMTVALPLIISRLYLSEEFAAAGIDCNFDREDGSCQLFQRQ